MREREKFQVYFIGKDVRYSYVYVHSDLSYNYKLYLTNPQRREHNTRSGAEVCCVMRVSIKEQKNLLN